MHTHVSTKSHHHRLDLLSYCAVLSEEVLLISFIPPPSLPLLMELPFLASFLASSSLRRSLLSFKNDKRLRSSSINPSPQIPTKKNLHHVDLVCCDKHGVWYCHFDCCKDLCDGHSIRLYQPADAFSALKHFVGKIHDRVSYSPRHCGLHLTYSFAAHLIVVDDGPVHQRARRNHNQNKKNKQNKKHVIQ